MKKRIPSPKQQPAVDPEILEMAKQQARAEGPKRIALCTVCKSETDLENADGLCWVCRRLKISAWRDTEGMPAQE